MSKRKKARKKRVSVCIEERERKCGLCALCVS